MTHTMTHLLLACGTLAAVAVAPAAALTYSASIKTFGHSVKNGPLPAYPVRACVRACVRQEAPVPSNRRPQRLPPRGRGTNARAGGSGYCKPASCFGVC